MFDAVAWVADDLQVPLSEKQFYVARREGVDAMVNEQAPGRGPTSLAGLADTEFL